MLSNVNEMNLEMTLSKGRECWRQGLFNTTEPDHILNLVSSSHVPYARPCNHGYCLQNIWKWTVLHVRSVISTHYLDAFFSIMRVYLGLMQASDFADADQSRTKYFVIVEKIHRNCEYIKMR